MWPSLVKNSRQISPASSSFSLVRHKAQLMKQYCHFIKGFSRALKQSSDISNMLCELMQVVLSCHFCQLCFRMETVIQLLAGLLELLFT